MANTKVVSINNPQKGPQMPAKTATLHVEYRDPMNGLLYAGDFVVKHLNLREIGQVGIARARMNGGLDLSAIDPRIDSLHSMLAHLQTAIVKAPEWWKPEELYTADLAEEVYKKVLDFETSFRRPMGEGSEAAQGNSAGQSEGQYGDAPPLVGQEVPDTANGR